MISEENAQLRREIRRLKAELARSYETIDAMLNISRCIASRVPFAETTDSPRYPEIGTGRIPADPALPIAGSASLPTPACVAGGDARAYLEVHA